MKKIILILLFALSLKAQDIIDPESILDDLNYSSTFINPDHDEFIYGWNWGSEAKKLDEVLGINFIIIN